MTPAQFKAARLSLGLSVNQMAQMLGMSEVQVRRMEAHPDVASSRPVSPTTQRLVEAFLAGYRPQDWPKPQRAPAGAPRGSKH